MILLLLGVYSTEPVLPEGVGCAWRLVSAGASPKRSDRDEMAIVELEPNDTPGGGPNDPIDWNTARALFRARLMRGLGSSHYDSMDDLVQLGVIRLFEMSRIQNVRNLGAVVSVIISTPGTGASWPREGGSLTTR